MEEEFEDVPWSHLIAEHRRSRLGFAGVVGLVVAVVAVAGWVLLRDGSPPTPPPASVAVPAAEGPSPASSPLPPAAPAPTTTAPVVLTEAELRAATPADAVLAAAARAEWFVTDYFTVDGDPGAADAVAAHLLDDAPPPDLPDDATSYVEWARAWAVERLDARRYAVSVVFRSLYVYPEDGEWYRSPAKAVEVIVAVADDGTSAVADLPMPVLPPDAAVSGGWPVDGSPVGEDVVEEAVAYARLFEDDPQVVGAGRGSAGWRVVLTVGDPSGARWPVAIRGDRLGG